MGKHKQVECQIYFKPMRSNNVKRHMRVHQKYSPTNTTTQSTEDMCGDLNPETMDNIFDPQEESFGMKQKHEEEEFEAKTPYKEVEECPLPALLPMQNDKQPTDWKLMEDSVTVFKIYKLLQRMKK